MIVYKKSSRLIVYPMMIIAALMTGCGQENVSLDNGIKDCTIGENDIRQSVKNNWTYRDDIKSDYKTCMSGNSNRDVVYNDTNELAKTCLESAHELNGGVVASFVYPKSYIAAIETSLRSCGELK